MDKPKQPAQNISKGTTIMINLWQYWLWEGGIQNQKGFWLEINITKENLLNFANWCNGEV